MLQAQGNPSTMMSTIFSKGKTRGTLIKCFKGSFNQCFLGDFFLFIILYFISSMYQKSIWNRRQKNQFFVVSTLYLLLRISSYRFYLAYMISWCNYFKFFVIFKGLHCKFSNEKELFLEVVFSGFFIFEIRRL